MIPFSYKKLFQKEPKKIIRTVGLFYVFIGAWALFVMTLQDFTFEDIPQDEQITSFNNTAETLQSIWTTYMPILIFLGLVMVVFSFLIERLFEHRITIQTIILISGMAWALAYSIACIPFMKDFQNMTPEQPSFNVIAMIFAIFGFAGVLAMMFLPNYKILKKLKAENTDM